MSKMRLESSAKGTSSSSNDGLSLDVPIVHQQPRVATFRDFPKGCGRFAVLHNAKSSIVPIVAGCGESLIVGVDGSSTLAEGEAIKKSVHPVRFGNSEIFMFANSTKSLGTHKTLVSEPTNREKDLNEGEPLNLIKTMEPVVRETIHEPYPSQRRTSFHDFSPGYRRFVPTLNDEKRQKLVASSKSQSLNNSLKEIAKGNAKRMEGKVHVDPKHVVEKKGRGDKYESPAYGGRDRSISQVSGLEAKRPTATPSRVVIGKGKEKVHDMHVERTNLVMKKDRGDKYESHAYGGRGRAISMVSGLIAKRPTTTPSSVVIGKGKEKKHDMHDYPTNLAKKRERDEYEYPAYGGRGRAISMVSGLIAKRPTATPSSVVIAKGNEKEHDMHNDPTNLVNKKDRGDKYESPAYHGRGRSVSPVTLKAKRPTSTPVGIRSFVNKDVVARTKVKEVLRLFQAICRIFLQDREAKPKEDSKELVSKRVDMSAYKLLKYNNKFVNPRHQIFGPVPGVEVGDEFRYKAELAIVGLHNELMKGIHYQRKGRTYLATSIVACEELDNMDMPDVIIYSGQGGQPDRGKKKRKQAEDQKLDQGNLALKNSKDEESPVRVIRQFKEKTISNKIISRYIYDGLYLVEQYWEEQGCYGTNVFKFQLTRMPGQPELGIKEVQKSRQQRVGICEIDISRGNEKIAISAVNTLDKERPPSVRYMTKMWFPPRYNPIPPKGCQCTDGCLDSMKCSCVIKNGGKIPFNFSGDIVCSKPLVYECGPKCKCPPSCYNRVSQHGIKLQLEIFKTELRGWGVRSLNYISSGSFICEYTGQLLDGNEAEKRTGEDEYLFDIGNNYNDGNLWNELSNLIPPELQASLQCETVEDVGFTIDALKWGNVGRFINHSCSPNLYAQNVLYDHHDKRMPHIMLVAAEDIPPLQELTFHYNYKLDQVCDSDGRIKKKDCYCGSYNCSGRLY